MMVNNVRLQLSYDRLLDGMGNSCECHAGAELRDVEQQINMSRLYGYDENRLNGLPVDYNTSFLSIPSPVFSKDPYSDFNHNSATSDRYISYYINASYIYKQRYGIIGQCPAG